VRSFLLLLALLVLGATTWAHNAGAGPDSPLYLALGDSLAAGVGATEPAQTGYVNLVFDALRTEPTSTYREDDLTLLNLGDPGETTTSMLTGGGQFEKALAEIDRRRDDGIDGNEVAIITIDIGANDFIPLIQAGSPCLPNFLAKSCLEAATSALDTFRSNFGDMMRRLRADAGPEAEIVALGLYNPLSGTGGPFDTVGDAALALFNDTVAEVVAEPDIQARLADVFPLFRDRGAELTHAIEIPPDVHPNDSGHYLMAQAVVTTLGLPADAVATPPSGAPAAVPAVSPSPTVAALPSAGGEGDDGTPWALYIGLVVAGVVVVPAGLLMLVRRRGR
jgi:acyl-CoA thioesterase-1